MKTLLPLMLLVILTAPPAGGAKLGAIAGVGIGLFVGYLMGSGKKTETENAISSRQKQFDDAMGQ